MASSGASTLPTLKHSSLDTFANSTWNDNSYGVSMADILKYILEGIAVAVAAFFVSPKNRKDYKSVI